MSALLVFNSISYVSKAHADRQEPAREPAHKTSGVPRGLKDSLPKSGELSRRRTPHLHSINIIADDIFEMLCQGPPINFWPAALRANTLGYVKDDGSKPILVNPNFLVIWNLANLTKS